MSSTYQRELASQNATGWRRVLVAPLVWLVMFYRRWISPAIPPSCRYYPTCSTYGLVALRRFGPIRGSWLTFRRLVRCHPWSAGGVDHVPPADGGTYRSPEPPPEKDV